MFWSGFILGSLCGGSVGAVIMALFAHNSSYAIELELERAAMLGHDRHENDGCEDAHSDPTLPARQHGCFSSLKH